MQRVPPITVNLAQACKKCFRHETSDQKLLKCSRCRGVAYCNAECQKADWKAHKAICSAFAAMESDASMKKLTGSLPVTASEDLQNVNDLCQKAMTTEVALLTGSMKRALKLDERNMVGWQPRCMGCSRTDRLIRIEGSTEGKVLKPCAACKTAFYCSQEHWDAVLDKHTSVAEGSGDLSQCQINQHFRTDIVFANLMTEAHNRDPEDPYIFQWAPERHLSTWQPLKTGDKCWEEEFEAPLGKEFGAGSSGVPITLGPFMRGASEGLSMPMTILYALQKLNSSDDWAKKRSLTIHLLGAQEKEISHFRIFDEILHRLPQLKDLQLIMIGPELPKVPKPADTPPCLTCAKEQKKCEHHRFSMTYHEYVKRHGTKYTKPDLAVAFNSGASETPKTWEETIKVLVSKKVATVFTAYNREEAETEAELLRAAGANLIPKLGPMRNPWGSLKLIPEPNRVTGFYATNGWLVGGFC